MSGHGVVRVDPPAYPVVRNRDTYTPVHSCGEAYNCPHCGAVIFPAESSKCCADGTRVLDEVDNPPVSAEESALLLHTAASHDSRAINSLLCFAAFGTTPTQSAGGSGLHTPLDPPCVSYCMGTTYHLWVPPSIDGPARRHALAGDPLLLSPTDSVDRVESLSASARDLHNRYRAFLQRVNPFTRTLAHIGDERANGRVREEPTAIRISPSTPLFCDTEIALVYDDGPEGPPERFAVTFPLRHDPTARFHTVFVPDFCELYDSMHYALLFPFGRGGYNFPATRTRRIRYYNDARFLEAAASRPSLARPGPDGHRRPFTLFEWAKAMIFQSFRLRALARLSQAFILDTFARWQHDEFQAKRDNPNIQRFRAPRRAFDEGTVQDERQRIAIRLPSKVIGSQKYNAARIADGMAVVRAYGKPTFFITFVSKGEAGESRQGCYPSTLTLQTANYHWPEIQQLFARPGQSTADLPQAIMRVFHLKLKVSVEQLTLHGQTQDRVLPQDMIRDLRSGRAFGRKAVYVLSVVEFQKRGVPHAHSE